MSAFGSNVDDPPSHLPLLGPLAIALAERDGSRSPRNWHSFAALLISIHRVANALDEEKLAADAFSVGVKIVLLGRMRIWAAVLVWVRKTDKHWRWRLLISSNSYCCSRLRRRAARSR